MSRVLKLSFSFNLSKLHPRHWNPRIIWDVFMVWVALVNMWMILFDLSYLLLRKHYFRWVPVVTRVYDPVKGIEPHPVTNALLEELAETRQLLALDPASETLDERVGLLRELTLKMLDQNPFERSGQSSSLDVVRLVIAHEVGATTHMLESPQRRADVVEQFWSPEPALLALRLDLFERELGSLLAANYFREFDARGHLVDHFFLLDLPFLLLFAIEFAVRWFLALRRKTYPRWFLFPIANWYDVLGLIPYTRIFRLFRIASIYMRLHRSEMSKVGKDFLSRGVAYISNIVAEEISDVVALRILTETQEEIQEGTARRIWDSTIESRRRLIEEVMICQLREILGNEETQERIRTLLALNLNNAVEQTDALKAVPLPNAVLRPLVRGIGQVILETTLETVTMTLASREGEEAARELVASVMDQVLSGAGRDVVDSMAEQISFEVIEEMKAAVAVKKWALPDSKNETKQLPAKS